MNSKMRVTAGIILVLAVASVTFLATPVLAQFNGVGNQMGTGNCDHNGQNGHNGQMHQAQNMTMMSTHSGNCNGNGPHGNMHQTQNTEG